MEKIFKSIISVLGVLAGIAIVVVGVFMLKGEFSKPIRNNISTGVINQTSMNQSRYSFGGDFYTEMFSVTYDADSNIVKLGDTTANAASSITGNQKELLRAMKTSQENIVDVVGICVIIAGAIVLLVFLYLFANAISLPSDKTKKKPQVVIPTPMLSSQEEL